MLPRFSRVKHCIHQFHHFYSVDTRYYRENKDNASRNVMNIYKRFQSKDPNCSCADDENITEYIIPYGWADLDFRLPQPEKRQVLLNLFSDEAPCYHNLCIQGHRNK